MVRWLCLGLVVQFVGGCASYGVVENAADKTGDQTEEAYSIHAYRDIDRRGRDSVVNLAFSGGGTRAAALSYGVLKALRDTPITTSEGPSSMLDQVDTITAVSGGSFTAAYFGLYGNGIFQDYEQAFLRRDIEGELLQRALNPLYLFSSIGRTERAVKFYDEAIFKGATYADMLPPDKAPLIALNASDLGSGARFSFVQEYFSLLCSDLSSFPVARAVAASSAVPVLFNPVVLENYPDCGSEVPDWLLAARARSADDPEMALVVRELETYFDRKRRKYVHLVDGGITDNLGLRALYEVNELAGGSDRFLQKMDRQKRPRRIVLITVNASTNAEQQMDLSNRRPSLEETVNAMSDIQLHRYNSATIALMKKSINEWAEQLSTPELPVKTYFIEVSLEEIVQPDRRHFFNRIPTSFRLSDEQVDALIDAGGELLRNNSEYARLLADIAAANERRQSD